MTLTRLESFPFDSRYDGFDDEGYPVYDRAVGARTMRDVFAHFFSDGVFSDTTYPFRLTKAASGLAVTVNPGVIIINGGWGILPEATTLTLATGTTAGVIKYAVFARYDNNDEHRTIYLRTDASSAGGTAPEPVTTEANVTEYRIGYITVPSNASDLSSATITNEVGTSMCPYAVPLFDIDPAEVLEDLRQDAQTAYDKYYALLESALDGTTAGELANRISDVEARTATLEENQFTQESIDAQALRAEMGLGNTTGVLGVPYGGTGVTSDAELLAKIQLGLREEIVLFNRSNSTASTDTTHYASVTINPGIYLAYACVGNSSNVANNSSYWCAVSAKFYLDGKTIISRDANAILGGTVYQTGYEVVALRKAVTLGSSSSSSDYASYYVSSQYVPKLAVVQMKLIKLADL